MIIKKIKLSFGSLILLLYFFYVESIAILISNFSPIYVLYAHKLIANLILYINLFLVFYLFTGLHWIRYRCFNYFGPMIYQFAYITSALFVGSPLTQLEWELREVNDVHSFRGSILCYCIENLFNIEITPIQIATVLVCIFFLLLLRTYIKRKSA